MNPNSHPKRVSSWVLFCLASILAAASAFGQSRFNGEGVTIPDTNTVSSSVVSSGLVGNIEKVTVTLNGLTHGYPDDLDIALSAATNSSGANAATSTFLMSDAGGRFSLSGANLTYAQSGTVLPNDTTLSSGTTYFPTNYDGGDLDTITGLSSAPSTSDLRLLNDVRPNNKWTLYLADDQVVDPGSLASWTLSIWTTPVVSTTTPNITTPEDTAKTVNFTVNDSDNDENALTYTADYDHDKIASVTFGGSGNNRTATITPKANVSGGGATTVTLKVNDGLATITQDIAVTVTPVNDAPTISLAVNSTAVTQNGITTNIYIFLTDIDNTPETGLTLFATSSDNSVVSTTNVYFAATSTNTPTTQTRVMRISPTGNKTGTATLTIGVTDGSLTNSATITVAVNPVSQVVAANPAKITINDATGTGASTATPYPSTLNVANVSGLIAKATVTLLDFEHENVSDVGVLLVSPTGQKIVLMRGAGGNNSLETRLVFDQSAGAIPAGALTTATNGPADYGTGDFPSAAPAGPYSASLAGLNGTNPNGTWSLYVVDTATGNVGAINGGWLLTIYTAPTIGTIGNRSTPEDTPITITFSVADQDGSVTNVTAHSSNTGIVPDPTVSLSGGTVTLTANPKPDQNGTVTITVDAQDNNGFVTSKTFDLTVSPVNDNPTASVIGKQITTAGVPTSVATFTVNDIESAPELLTVTATSDNPKLLPTGSIILGGTGANRTIQFFPAGAQAGQANVTVTVNDPNGGSVSQIVDLTVNEAANPLFENTSGIAINDASGTTPGSASPYPSIIHVSGLVGQVAEVQVTLLGIIHPQPDDLDVLLVGPNGQSVMLMSDVGGGSDKPLNSVTLVFKQSASGSLPDEDQIISGSYKPTDIGGGDVFPTLTVTPGTDLDAAFDNSNPNGDWKLYVVDDVEGPRGGVINSWELSIRTHPAIAAIPDQTTEEDTPLRLTVSLGDNQAGIPYTIATSHSGTPNVIDTITTTRSGSGLTILITPVADAFGTNSVTVTVTDPDGTPTSSTFNFGVTPINDAPRFTPATIADKSTPAATPFTQTFSVVDPEGSTVTLTKQSSNPDLVPVSNITITGTAPNYTLTALPVGNMTGRTTITVTADDGHGQKQSLSFVLNVTPNVSFANTGRIVINDNTTANPYPSVINVSGVEGIVSGVSVILDGFTHQFPDDVDVLLVSPDNKKIMLMSDAGGSAPVSDLRLTFANGAGAVPDTSLASATYSPFDYEDTLTGEGVETLPSPAPGRPYSTDLSTLNGVQPNGDWKLFIRDDQFSLDGAINRGWILVLKTGPVITQIPNQNMTEDVPLVIPFTVSDQDSTAAQLTVTKVLVDTEDPGLLGGPSGTNLVISGTGNSRVLTIYPVANRFSASASKTNKITLTVEDESHNTASTTFGVRVLPVNDAPTITVAYPGSATSFTTTEDTQITFHATLSDVDSPGLASTNVTVTSSNPALVPNGTNIVVAGTGSDVAITVYPVANASGATILTITATDPSTVAPLQTVSTNVTLNVTPVNDVPTITLSTNQVEVTAEGTTPVVTITVTDVETTDRNLVVTATSSDTSIIPNANIVIGGSGATRTITATALSRAGSADLTITVSDGSTSSSAVLAVTVTPAPGSVFANTSPITIRDNNTASPYPSQINVTGMRGPVSRVTATLDGFQHTAPDDVDVLLVSPTGKKVLLLSDTGGRNPVTNVRLTFDQTGRVLGDDAPLTSGVYQPANYESTADSFASDAPAGPYSGTLAAFNGDDANGEWDLYVVDDTGNDSGQIAFGWSLKIETAPTISNITPSSKTTEINENVAGAPTSATVTFTIDDMTSTDALKLTYQSSNPTLLPTSNIAQTRTGGSVSLQLTPAPNQNGTNLLTITVSRPSTTPGVSDAATSVVITNIVHSVDTPPTLSRLNNLTTQQDTAVAFDVLITDLDTPLSDLWLEAVSSDETLIANTNILINGRTNFVKGLSDSIVTIRLVPNPGQRGTATITLNLTEGGNNPYTGDNDFTLTVTPRNNPPTITGLAASIGVDAGSTTANIPFTVGDDGSSVTIASNSSNPAVIPSGNISITPGTGAPGARNLRVTAPTGVTGSSTITITATDDAGQVATASIRVDVAPTRDREFSNTRVITIRDNTTAEDYPSIINVTGLAGQVSKVTVTLNGLTHRYPDDVDIMLVSPSGQSVMLMSDAGGGFALTDAVLTFADGADSAVFDNEKLVNGSYKPANYEGTGTDPFVSPAPSTASGTTLASISGSANGDWKLFIVDDTASDAGVISGGWKLTLTTHPVLVGLQDITSEEDVPARQSFTVAEESFIATTNFHFTATSTNTALVPNANIAVTGEGTNYTVTVTPTANATGQTKITLTLQSGTQTTTSSFLATFTAVNDRPTITSVADTNLTAGGFVSIPNFNYSDIETAKKDIDVSISSSNPSVIPVGNIVIVGNELQISSEGSATGSSEITITVTDEAGASAETTFVATVLQSQSPLFANTDGITIVDNGTANPYPSSITVSNVNGTVTKVTVTLTDVRHDYPDDVDILLVGPNGKGVELLSDAGAGNGESKLTGARLTFDDAAAQSAPDNSPLNPTGIYKPSNYEGSDFFASPAPAGPYETTLTAAFAGSDPNGTWSLYVVDDGSPDAGSIGSWILKIQTTAPTISQIQDQVLAEDTAVTVPFHIEDGDTAASGLTVTATVDSSPVTTLTINGTGNDRTLTITPRANANGSDVITVTVTDGVDSASTSFTATITPVNDAPFVSGLNNTNTAANARLRIPFTVADVETDSSALVVTAASSNEGAGTVTLDGEGASRTLVFNPAGVSPTNTTVTVIVSDGELSTTNTFVIDVTAPLGPVIAPIATQTGSEDTVVLIPVSVSTTTPEDLTVTAVAENTNLVTGIVATGTGATRVLQVSLVPNAFGTTPITVTARDAFSTTNQTFTLNVPNTPDAPVISPIADQTTMEDVPVDIVLNVTDVDTTLADLAFSSSVSNPSLVTGITFTKTESNVVAHVSLGEDQNGVAAVTILATDGSNTATATFALTVQPVADLPRIAEIGNVTTGEDVGVTVPFTITNPDSTELNVGATFTNPSLISGVAIGGTGNNRTAQVTLVPNAIGTATVTVTAGNNNGTVSQDFTLTVTNLDNDAPTIAVIPDQATGEGMQLVVNLDVTDPDSEISTLHFAGAADTTNIVSDLTFDVTASNTVALIITPVSGATGTDRVTVSVSDGGNVARTSFNLTVTNVNQAPVLGAIADQTTVQGAAVTIPLTVSDRETAVSNLTFTATTSNSNLVQSVSFDTTGNNAVATLNLSPRESGNATVTITVSDGGTPVSRTFNLHVIHVPHAPNLEPIPNQTAAAGAILRVTLHVTDEDDLIDDLIFLSSPSGTNVVQSVTFAPDTENTVLAIIRILPDATGSDSVLISVSDGETVSRQNFTITINNTAAPTLTSTKVGNNLSVTVTGTPGTTFVIEGATDVTGPYTEVGTVVIGTGGSSEAEVPITGAHRFFRARAQ